MAISAVVLQSASSEIIPADLPRKIGRKMKFPKTYRKKFRASSRTLGFKAYAEIESHNAAYIKACPLYAMIGKHAASVRIAPGKWKW